MRSRAKALQFGLTLSVSEGEDVAPNRAHQLQYFATIFRDCTLDSEMSAFRPLPGLIELR